MKNLFGILAAVGGLAALWAMGLVFYGVLQRGTPTLDAFNARLLAIGSITYIVGQLGFISFGGKIKA